jgi:SRSO17 transposase
VATPWSIASSTCPNPGRRTENAAKHPGIPDERIFATKGDLARCMTSRAPASPLPIAWVTADSAYGQDSHFRRFREDAQLSYVVAIPKWQQVNGPRIGAGDSGTSCPGEHPVDAPRNAPGVLRTDRLTDRHRE